MNHIEPTPELLADLNKWLDDNSEVITFERNVFGIKPEDLEEIT